MPADLIIIGKIATSKGVFTGGIVVKGRKIVDLKKEKNLPEADEKRCFRDKYILPGGIDAHVHFHDPDYLYREDIESGSLAAAAGGITTVVDLPLRKQVLPPHLNKKIKAVEKHSYIDVALQGGVMTPSNLHLADETINQGVRTFKAFTCSPFYNSYLELKYIIKKINSLGATVTLHAEDEGILEKRQREMVMKNRNDPLAHADARPTDAERKAVERVLSLVEELNARVHFAHLTTKEATSLIFKAKKIGLKVTAETCPHYLYFTRDDMKKLGPYLKINPALKDKKDVEALWNSLATGLIDIVVTDHAPGTKEEKEVGWKNIWDAWGGVPGVETLLPFLMSEGVNKKRVSIKRLIKLISEKPAEIFGLNGKGKIEKGYDADFVIVDLRKENMVKAENLHYKVGWTPWEGIIFKGWPIMTILRGKVIYDREIMVKPGYGRYIKV